MSRTFRLGLIACLLLWQLPAVSVRRPVEIWIGSNVATRDLARFAVDPGAWPSVASVTDVFTFYSQALTASERSDCATCEENIFPQLSGQDAFHAVHERNVRVNVEIGVVKDWDCDGAKNIEVAFRILERFRSLNIPISHFSMDEPFMAGEVWCRQPAADTAEKVGRFMSVVRRQWTRSFPEVPVSIGLIEPYPRHEMAAIIEFVRLLLARGQRPSYFHLDVNKHEMERRGYDDHKIAADLRMLSAFLNREAIPAGTFFASFAGASPDDYRADFLDTVSRLKHWGAPMRHLVFQSWEQTREGGATVNRRPNNTPETDPYSLTGLTRDALRLLQSR